MKTYKTQGLEWLEHSMTSFNGSGYADRYDIDSFIDSYKAYAKWKGRYMAQQLAETHAFDIRAKVFDLLQGLGPSHTPSTKKLEQFKTFYTYKND